LRRVAFALPGLFQPGFLHLKIQFFLIPQRNELNLLHAMVFNLQRFKQIVAHLNLFPGCGIRCKYSISRPAMVWYSRFSSSGSGTYCTRSSSGIWPLAVHEPSAFF
jgi:hypothetical protein